MSKLLYGMREATKAKPVIVDLRVNKAVKELNFKIEEHIKLAIKPKPKWLPDIIWKLLLKKLFILEKLHQY